MIKADDDTMLVYVPKHFVSTNEVSGQSQLEERVRFME